MNKFFALVLAVCFVFLAAMPAGALSLVPPETYNERYTYYHIDFNRDGMPELITHGGEPGGYTDDYPEYKVYTNVDGEMKLFKAAQGSDPMGVIPLRSLAHSRRNRFTRQRKWICEDGINGWGRVTISEITFDFEALEYHRQELAFTGLSSSLRDRIRYRLWKCLWKAEAEPYWCEGSGILTPERIEWLLNNWILLYPPT